ncbi:MAG: hemerythrin domain-containing protein [Rhodospirillaceae bacterium]
MVDHMLHDEHVASLDIINRLEVRIGNGKWAKRLDSTVPADRHLLEQLVSMMNSEVHHHLPFEEKELFPKLDELGFEDITGMLFDEHEAIRSLAKAIILAANDALANGFNEDKWSKFFDNLAEMIGIIIFHIQKEEMGVISRLEMLLGAETCHEMAVVYRSLISKAPT